MENVIMNSLVEKLHPSRFPNLSGKMVAMVAHVLSVEWTTPAIREINITSDGFLVSEGDFLGSVNDWGRNLAGLFAAAELTQAEKIWFMKLHRMKIRSYMRNQGLVWV